MSAILPESINTENECDAAEAWGEEDAIQGNGSCAPRYFIPGSLQWNAYEAGYSRGQQLLGTRSKYDPSIAQHARTAMPQRLPQDNPGIWALRGYEDALFDRPIRNRLPPDQRPGARQLSHRLCRRRGHIQNHPSRPNPTINRFSITHQKGLKHEHQSQKPYPRRPRQTI